MLGLRSKKIKSFFIENGFLIFTLIVVGSLPIKYFYSQGTLPIEIRREDAVPALSENDYYKWKSESPYTVVNYFSLDCPHCLKLDEAENKNYTSYKDSFSLVYRHSPLTDIQPYSGEKAVLAECVQRDAGTENMFLFISDIYAHYKTEGDMLWTSSVAKKYVKDKEGLNACTQSKEVRNFIIKKRIEALSYGVNGTPTIIVFKNNVQVARFDMISEGGALRIMNSLVAIKEKK